jgi:hypothetical protein
MTRPKCQRCSDCAGQEHHWIEEQPSNLEHDYVCRHCGVVCSMNFGGDCDDGPDEVARHSTTAIVAAYIRDRAAQYEPSSGSRVALENVAAALGADEHLAAYDAGELDDMLPEVAS